MVSSVHPEVLASDWVPPVALGRGAAVAEVVRRLDPPRPRMPPPWTVAVAGSGGSGTSTVARLAAREVADRVRTDRVGPPPRVLVVRTSVQRGTHGVAAGLLRRLDEGFDGRGFPVAEVIAGVLRRLRREARPTVVVLDDVGVGGPDLAPIVRALAAPDRFLPEGEFGLPPTWTILAGRPEALATVEASLRGRVSLAPFVSVSPYSEVELAAIVRDRVVRAMGLGGGEELVAPIVERALADGGGAVRAVELLRRRLIARSAREADGRPGGVRLGVVVEPHVVRALETAAQERGAALGDVKRCEAELARAHGARPLPTTTLWRRIVQLERAGYIRREIRPGGLGGTRSVVRLLAPVDEWVTSPSRPGSPRAVAALDPETWGPPPAPGSESARWHVAPTLPDDPTD